MPHLSGRSRVFSCGGFSLIELICVLGIVVVLCALLLPALAGARRHALRVQCQSNLRQMGITLLLYQNENRGWFFPVQELETGEVIGFGTNVPPHERWPTKAFKLRGAPATPSYDPSTYRPTPYQPARFPAEPYTPPVLSCPADQQPYEAHSYVLNDHLAEKGLKAGDTNFGGLGASEVILAGEKRTLERDYYMQFADFDRVVEQYRHGLQNGSNYLYLDGHVGTVLPREALTGIDPWDLRVIPITR